MGHEALESRNLLAGMVGDSPWQNPLDADDLDCDGDVTPADALVAINALNGGQAGPLDLKSAPPILHGVVKGAIANFMDVNGDGDLSPADALGIINHLNFGHHGGLGGDVPTDDLQGGDIASAKPLALSDRGFAKVLSAINTDGDVDVFQVSPTKTQLSVGLFSAAGGALTVTLLDASGAVVDSASTDPASHHPVKVDATVEAGKVYYVQVNGAAGTTGVYGLAVLNYDASQFQPDTDSELGNDIHGDTPATATALTLNQTHARVISNIDAAADKDMFSVDVTDGKLVVEAGAEFPLNVEITDASGNVVGTILTSSKHATTIDVTHATGPYFITVAAANATDTGAYHVNVVNAPIPSLPGHDHHDDDGDDHGGAGDHHLLPTPEELFVKLDKSGDHAVSREELAAGVPFGNSPLVDRIFANWDADHDLSLTLEEFTAGLANMHLPRPHGGLHHGPSAPLLTFR